MLISTIFTYGLSVIWLDLSTNVLILLLISTLVLLSSSFMLTKVVDENWNLLKERWTKFRRMVLIYVGIAFMVKLILQLLTNVRSEEHTSELQSRGHLVCRLLLEKKKR